MHLRGKARDSRPTICSEKCFYSCPFWADCKQLRLLAIFFSGFHVDDFLFGKITKILRLYLFKMTFNFLQIRLSMGAILNICMIYLTRLF